MAVLFFDQCDGPPCTRCGCRDVKIITEPAPGVMVKHGARIDITIPGIAQCNHCGQQFSFFPKLPMPTPTRQRCPECGNVATAASTRAAVKWYKCHTCGNSFKVARK